MIQDRPSGEKKLHQLSRTDLVQLKTQSSKKKRIPWLKLLLFGLTFFTTTLSAATPVGGETLFQQLISGPLLEPNRLIEGLQFSIPLMAILLAHEMGHYATAQAHNVDMKLPLFLPAPGTPFGTMGAIIVMPTLPQSKEALLRIAIMGPYAGLILAIPITAWGLIHSTPIDTSIWSGPTLLFGSSILFTLMETIFSPNGSDVLIHRTGLAGWVGLLLTSLNLLPIGQLDGGHILYSIVGKLHTHISRLMVLALLTLGIYLGPNGLLWVALGGLLCIMGLTHPQIKRDSTSLGNLQKFHALTAMFIFVITFTPVPIRFKNLNPTLTHSPTGSTPSTSTSAPPSPSKEYKL